MVINIDGSREYEALTTLYSQVKSKYPGLLGDMKLDDFYIHMLFNAGGDNALLRPHLIKDGQNVGKLTLERRTEESFSKTIPEETDWVIVPGIEPVKYLNI